MELLWRNGFPVLIDPNSKAGLTLEGARARARGKSRDTNPYTESHPGSLAEDHWFEGWDLYEKTALLNDCAA